MIKKSANSIDWAAKWFEIRAEMGQSDVATMMYQDVGSPLKREHFHHREADGFGRIQKILKDEGIEVHPPIRKLKKPASWKRFFLLFKGLVIHPRVPHNPWVSYSQDKSAGLPDEVSYLFLTKSENERLKQLAKEKSLNLGFFILSELDQIIKKNLFKNPQDKGTWLCPVDLRGSFENAPANQNFVSFVTAEIRGVDNYNNVKDAFENYKTALKNGIYWSFWELSQIGRWIGLSGMRFLARQATNKSFWMGSFSDLGVWNQKELLGSHARNRYWIIAPPGSHAYPVGITTIEWCGNRSITMKLHPGICAGMSTDISASLLQQFKQKLLPNSSSEIRQKPAYLPEV